MDPYPSPLRYPGGKGKLTNFIKLVFESNNLLDGQYVEPYAGGASIALNLLFGEYVSRIHINDISKGIYSFWYSVINKTDLFCKLIKDTRVSMNEWNKQKCIQSNLENHSILEIGFSTFFLNRTNRSGIIKGGVIGGKKQIGNWKIDARFNKPSLIERIKRIARYKNRISIYNMDASKFIIDELPSLPNNTLVYLDPPYYAKGKALYEDHYNHNDHAFMAELIRQKINQPWIVSYDSDPNIIQFYRGFKTIHYSLNYSAAVRYKGTEVMFHSNQLNIPRVDDPSKIGVSMAG